MDLFAELNLPGTIIWAVSKYYSAPKLVMNKNLRGLHIRNIYQFFGKFRSDLRDIISGGDYMLYDRNEVYGFSKDERFFIPNIYTISRTHMATQILANGNYLSYLKEISDSPSLFGMR